MKCRKRINTKLFLILLILGISVGYALLSTTLGINGISGIKKNTWDIHWNEESIVETPLSVTASSPASVVDTEKKNIAFSVELELPGDFYEFTADAKNYGSIDGEVDEVKIKIYEHGEADPIDPEDLPEYIIYSFTHADGSAVEPGEVIASGESISYKFRIEYDENATSLPGNGNSDPIDIVIDIPVNQPTQEDPSKPYKITFNPNGGTVETTTKSVERGETIGELPTPTKNGVPFLGWYTDITNGYKITAAEIPTKDTTYYAHWADNYTIFDTGKNVNVKLKTFVGDTIQEENPWYTNDTRIYKILKSDTAPGDGVTTINIAAEGEIPIYAWYTNNNIYWYTEATTVYTNEDASNMFTNFNYLNELDTSFDTSLTTNMNGMFASGITTIDLSHLNTSKVTDMGNMFSGIKASSLDLRSFDTSNVTNMSYMFYGAGAYSINVSSFDTRKVTNMNGMFLGIQATTLDLSNFRTPSLTSMDNMFTNAKVTSIDLSKFDVSNVTNFSNASIFAGSSLKTINLNNWNFSSATSLYYLFAGAIYAESISLKNVNTSTITDTGYMFSGLSKLKSIDLSYFDTNSLTNANWMFGGCTSLKSINMDNWDFASLTNLSSFFNGVSSVQEISLKNVNTSNVTSMASMFYGCSSLKQLDLRSFNTSNVTSMDMMFVNASSLTTILVSDDFVVDQVTSSSGMFGNTSSIIGGMGTTYDSSHVDKAYAHYDGGVSNPGYFQKGNALYYTINLNPTGGNVTPTSVDVVRTLAIGNLPTPTRTNYTFDGWYTAKTGGDLVDSSYVPTKSQTIYAHWTATPTHTVTFNGNGGTVSEASRVVVDGEKVGTLPTASRYGYAFDGWYLDTQSGVKIDHSYVPTTDITVKAKWIEIEAMFDTGINVNEKFKTLAGTELATGYSDLYLAENTNVTAILRSTTEPTAENKTEEHVVSAPNSNVPIYAWFDNGTIYWWTSANVAFTNPDASYMFARYSNLTNLDTNINTSQTTDMLDMFYYNTGIVNLDVSGWDTRKVNNMTSTFYCMYSLETLDMTGWSFESFTQGGSISASTGIQYDSNLKTLILDDVTFRPDMNTAFEMIKAETISLENVDSSMVVDMWDMFMDCSNVKTLDLSDFDTRNVTNMGYMFQNCTSLESIDVSSFDTSNVTNMMHMFCNTGLTSLDVSNFDTSKVENMGDFVLLNETIEELDLSNWDFRLYAAQNSWGAADMMNAMGVTTIDAIKKVKLDNAIFPVGSNAFFMSLKVDEISLKNVDTSYVTDMGNMFSGCTVEELDLSSFDTSNVTVMSTMFNGMSNIKTIYVGRKFTTDRLTTSTAMFTDSTQLVGGNGTTYDANHIDKEYARIDEAGSPGYFTYKVNSNGFGNVGSSLVDAANKIFTIKE